jgi:lipoyl(octanoyl) transferase
MCEPTKNNLEFIDWGLIDYRTAWQRQSELVAMAQATRGTSRLVFCEHPTVITIGRTGSERNVVANESFLGGLGIDTIAIDRGGDVTLHNPGQLVGYPIFDLMMYTPDLHVFLRNIEECVIELIAEYGISGGRVEGLTGVWIDGNRKICAIGLHCSRWITSHGFALNVSNNLDEFSYIVPCGITDKEVTSIEKELGAKVDMHELKLRLKSIFENKFSPNKQK